MPKISVVMPIYNSEKYIMESVDSVLNQTYEDFELLAIYDNGTTDATPKILQDYANKDIRVKPINIGEERGLVKALNHGIKIAQGEYIARMDADDICMPNRFEKQIEFFEVNKDISILGTAIEVFGDVDETIKNKYEKWFMNSLNTDNLECIALQDSIVAHPTVMMKKQIFNDLKGYDENFKEAEDYDLWLRALKNGIKFGNLTEKLLKYRIFKESKGNRANNIIDYIINAKLNYIEESLDDCGKCNYIIWGAGGGGYKAYKLIKNRYPEYKLSAFVDKFKTGEIDGINVIKPEEIFSSNFNYIFIAVTPGKDEVMKFLNENGLENIKHYIFLY